MQKMITSLYDGGEFAANFYPQTSRPKRSRKILGIFAVVLFVFAAAAALGGYFYWQSLKTTPQYSIALIIDAARQNDQKSINRLIDASAVVDDFVPQITSKAVEIYGRGLPPQTIARIARVAEPVMPAVKDRARSELPGVIRRKTENLESVPFAAMVLAAGRYLDIQAQGNDAIVKSLLPGRSFEVKMTRDGNLWKIVGVTDNELSVRIAKAIGQEIIFAASTAGNGAAAERLGIKNLNDLLKNAEEALK